MAQRRYTSQRDYEEQPEAPDLGASADDPNAPVVSEPSVAASEELDATRIDRSPETGGAGAGADGRQDAGPDAWR
jgi:hypothetical protein